METNFSQIVLDKLCSNVSGNEQSLLSDRLLNVANSVDNQNLTSEAKNAFIRELRIIRGEYIKSDCNLKWDALRLISQMETSLTNR